MAITFNRAAYENATEGASGNGIEPGAYVAVIQYVSAETSRKGTPYMDVVWDIAEGQHAGHYNDRWAAEHPYAHHWPVYYSDEAIWKLKEFMNVLERSNDGFVADAWLSTGDETALSGMYIGVVLQYETSTTGKRNLNCVKIADVASVRAGLVKVPDEKVPEKKPQPTYRAATPAQAQNAAPQYAQAQQAPQYAYVGGRPVQVAADNSDLPFTV